MGQGGVEPVLAGPDVEVVARVVPHLRPAAERRLRRGVRRRAAVEVRDLHEQRAAQVPGRAAGPLPAELEADRGVQLVDPRRAGDREVVLVGALERQRGDVARACRRAASSPAAGPAGWPRGCGARRPSTAAAPRRSGSPARAGRRRGRRPAASARPPRRRRPARRPRSARGRRPGTRPTGRAGAGRRRAARPPRPSRPGSPPPGAAPRRPGAAIPRWRRSRGSRTSRTSTPAAASPAANGARPESIVPPRPCAITATGRPAAVASASPAAGRCRAAQVVPSETKVERPEPLLRPTPVMRHLRRSRAATP